MAEERYINKDFPVYISYAWKKNDYPDIEKDVDNLCKAMNAAGIFYKRDREGLCPYRYSILKAEEEIGQGCAIIIAVSKRYIESLHCMNEWHCIRENGKIWERVFPIVLPCANITKEDVYNEYYEYFKKRKDTILEKQRKGISDLTKMEASAAESGYFFEDLKKLQKFVADYNMGKIIIRDNNYSVVINQLKDHLQNIMPHYVNAPVSDKLVGTDNDKHTSRRFIWVVVALLVALLTVWCGWKFFPSTKSNTVENSVQKVLDAAVNGAEPTLDIFAPGCKVNSVSNGITYDLGTIEIYIAKGITDVEKVELIQIGEMDSNGKITEIFVKETPKQP